eukprot:2832350-Pleurochrysis_carterae.AAC.2
MPTHSSCRLRSSLVCAQLAAHELNSVEPRWCNRVRVTAANRVDACVRERVRTTLQKAAAARVRTDVECAERDV